MSRARLLRPLLELAVGTGGYLAVELYLNHRGGVTHVPAPGRVDPDAFVPTVIDSWNPLRLLWNYFANLWRAFQHGFERGYRLARAPVAAHPAVPSWVVVCDGPVTLLKRPQFAYRWAHWAMPKLFGSPEDFHRLCAALTNFCVRLLRRVAVSCPFGLGLRPYPFSRDFTQSANGNLDRLPVMNPLLGPTKGAKCVMTMATRWVTCLDGLLPLETEKTTHVVASRIWVGAAVLTTLAFCAKLFYELTPRYNVVTTWDYLRSSLIRACSRPGRFGYNAFLTKSEFTRIPFPAPHVPPAHTHGLHAAERTAAIAHCRLIAANNGMEYYDEQASHSNLRRGVSGRRWWFWIKDLATPLHCDEITEDHLLALIDVDYYMDMSAYLGHHWNPVYLYTELPTVAAFDDPVEGKGWFNGQGQWNRMVPGGTSYCHDLMDWHGDTLKVTRRVFGIPVKVSVYDVQKLSWNRVNRASVFLTPITRVYFPVTVASGWLPGRELKKLDPIIQCPRVVGGPKNALGRRYVALNVVGHPEHSLSIGMPGHQVCANIKANIFGALSLATDTVYASSIRSQSETTVPNDVYLLQAAMADKLMDHYDRFAMVSYTMLRPVVAPAPAAPNQKALPGPKPVAIDPVVSNGPAPERTYKVAMFNDGDPFVPSVAPFMRPLVDGSTSPAVGPSNEAGAIAGRMYQVRTVKALSAAHADLAVTFARLILKDARVERLAPLTPAEVELRQPRPSQQRLLNEAGYVATSYALTRSRLSMFVKKETYANYNHPRPIQTGECYQRAVYARYCGALGDLLKLLSFYGFLSCEAITDKVVRIASRATMIADTDFSKFDGHVTQAGRDVMSAIVRVLFDPQHHAELEQMMKVQFNRIGYTKHDIRYDQGTGRASGSAETSVFNTLENAFIAFCSFVELGCAPAEAYDRLGLYGGDDGMTPDIDPDVYSRTASLFGHELKVAVKRRGDPLCFFARWFPASVWEGDRHSICDIARQAVKFHLAVVVPGEPIDKLIEKTISLAVNDAHTLGFGALIRAVQRFVDQNDYAVPEWVGFHLPGAFENAVTAETLDLARERAATIEFQIDAMEAYYNSLVHPTVEALLNHPGFGPRLELEVKVPVVTPDGSDMASAVPELTRAEIQVKLDGILATPAPPPPVKVDLDRIDCSPVLPVRPLSVEIDSEVRSIYDATLALPGNVVFPKATGSTWFDYDLLVLHESLRGMYTQSYQHYHMQNALVKGAPVGFVPSYVVDACAGTGVDALALAVITASPVACYEIDERRFPALEYNISIGDVVTRKAQRRISRGQITAHKQRFDPRDSTDEGWLAYYDVPWDDARATDVKLDNIELPQVAAEAFLNGAGVVLFKLPPVDDAEKVVLEEKFRAVLPSYATVTVYRSVSRGRYTLTFLTVAKLHGHSGFQLVRKRDSRAANRTHVEGHAGGSSSPGRISLSSLPNVVPAAVQMSNPELKPSAPLFVGSATAPKPALSLDDPLSAFDIPDGVELQRVNGASFGLIDLKQRQSPDCEVQFRRPDDGFSVAELDALIQRAQSSKTFPVRYELPLPDDYTPDEVLKFYAVGYKYKSTLGKTRSMTSTVATIARRSVAELHCELAHAAAAGFESTTSAGTIALKLLHLRHAFGFDYTSATNELISRAVRAVKISKRRVRCAKAPRREVDHVIIFGPQVQRVATSGHSLNPVLQVLQETLSSDRREPTNSVSDSGNSVIQSGDVTRSFAAGILTSYYCCAGMMMSGNDVDTTVAQNVQRALAAIPCEYQFARATGWQMLALLVETAAFPPNAYSTTWPSLSLLNSSVLNMAQHWLQFTAGLQLVNANVAGTSGLCVVAGNAYTEQELLVNRRDIASITVDRSVAFGPIIGSAVGREVVDGTFNSTALSADVTGISIGNGLFMSANSSVTVLPANTERLLQFAPTPRLISVDAGVSSTRALVAPNACALLTLSVSGSLRMTGIVGTTHVHFTVQKQTVVISPSTGIQSVFNRIYAHSVRVQEIPPGGTASANFARTILVPINPCDENVTLFVTTEAGVTADVEDFNASFEFAFTQPVNLPLFSVINIPNTVAMTVTSGALLDVLIDPRMRLIVRPSRQDAALTGVRRAIFSALLDLVNSGCMITGGNSTKPVYDLPWQVREAAISAAKLYPLDVGLSEHGLLPEFAPMDTTKPNVPAPSYAGLFSGGSTGTSLGSLVSEFGPQLIAAFVAAGRDHMAAKSKVAERFGQAGPGQITVWPTGPGIQGGVSVVTPDGSTKWFPSLDAMASFLDLDPLLRAQAAAAIERQPKLGATATQVSNFIGQQAVALNGGGRRDPSYVAPSRRPPASAAPVASAKLPPPRNPNAGPGSYRLPSGYAIPSSLGSVRGQPMLGVDLISVAPISEAYNRAKLASGQVRTSFATTTRSARRRNRRQRAHMTVNGTTKVEREVAAAILADNSALRRIENAQHGLTDPVVLYRGPFGGSPVQPGVYQVNFVMLPSGRGARLSSLDSSTPFTYDLLGKFVPGERVVCIGFDNGLMSVIDATSASFQRVASSAHGLTDSVDITAMGVTGAAGYSYAVGYSPTDSSEQAGRRVIAGSDDCVLFTRSIPVVSLHGKIVHTPTDADYILHGRLRVAKNLYDGTFATGTAANANAPLWHTMANLDGYVTMVSAFQIANGLKTCSADGGSCAYAIAAALVGAQDPFIVRTGTATPGPFGVQYPLEKAQFVAAVLREHSMSALYPMAPRTTLRANGTSRDEFVITRSLIQRLSPVADDNVDLAIRRLIKQI